MRCRSLRSNALNTGLIATLALASASSPSAQRTLPLEPTADSQPFRRIASFPVFQNSANEDDESVAEIVASAKNGNLLVYTDGANEVLGFVDITIPSSPQPDGVVALTGEPTSVGVAGNYALVSVNTSPNFINTSGNLEVIDLDTRSVVATLPLGGQPDAIAISPDERYAAIAIENERDEDLGNGEPPQAPPGFVVIVDLVGAPAAWTTRKVDLVGIPTLFPNDPEPEFVDINAANVAVVTMQENNHAALIRLSDGMILQDFSFGTADLTDVDVNENDLIEQTANLDNVPREPDAVTWTSIDSFSTADEGDLFGGSRGFTQWSLVNPGTPLFEAGNTIEHLAARLGHYPEDRSENKGTEPEGIEFGQFGPAQFLFVGSERANLVLVYEMRRTGLRGRRIPRLRQVLPTGVAPEGLLAIPERDLFVVACEEDNRGDKIRATLMIYARRNNSNYPTIVSQDKAGQNIPIAWGALSGLAADPQDQDTIYTIHDSFYVQSRIYTLDVSQAPAVIESELVLTDSGDVLTDALTALQAQLPGAGDFDPSAIVNADGTVNLDPEGITVAPDGSFWLASEGSGNLVAGVSDPNNRPFASPNALLNVDATGAIIDVVLPPLSLTSNQLRFGFEGVAITDDALFVAFQRAWQDAGDPSDRARIGRFDLTTRSWSFAYYPLDTPTSANGGWVGLSDLTWLGGDDFAVVERDNQGGPDAAIKRLYRMSIAGVNFQTATRAGAFDDVRKTLASDLLLDGAFDVTGGLTPEKIEGLAVLADGTTLIVNDNDGVDDNNGETQLLELGALFQ